MGGLARKASIIDSIKSEGYNPIVVDAGNLLFKNRKPTIGVANEINKIKAETIVSCFNSMGCDAFSPGENDFSDGLAYILELNEKANFPFISANIVNNNNKLIFSPYVIVDNDIRIAFIGLSSVFFNSDVSILNPLSSLLDIIDEVRSKSDLVILLFNANDEDVIKLQNSDINIDLIIRSKSRKRSNDGGTKRIPVYSSGDRGKYLYRLDLKLSQSGISLTDITSQNNIIKQAQKRLNRMKNGTNGIQLKEFYKDDNQILNRILGYEKQLKLAKDKLNNAYNTIDLVSYELGKKIDDKPSILKIVDTANEKINLIKGPQLPSGHEGHNH